MAHQAPSGTPDDETPHENTPDVDTAAAPGAAAVREASGPGEPATGAAAPQPFNDEEGTPGASDAHGPIPYSTPDLLQRLRERLAEMDRQRSEWGAERAEKDAEREEERERQRAEKDAQRERQRAEKEAERAERDAERERQRAVKERQREQRAEELRVEAEEQHAREEERVIAREERRRARMERTVRVQPERVTFSSTLRQAFWRVVMIPVGGVRVKGTFPQGPLVILPNHTSHMDTVAMMAGAPTVMRVIPVAAADYWFRSPFRAWIARRAIGAFPIERGGHGAYRNLRELLRPRVEEACSILIFAEGTRSPDGKLQKFKKGPALLSRDFDIPLLPVAIVGAFEAWPKGGKLRYSPVELRVGEPIEPSDDIEGMIELARERIIALQAQGPASQPTSALFHWMHRKLRSPLATVGFFLFGVANTVIWVVPAEASIALIGAARRDRQFVNVAAVCAGSAVGVGAWYLLARRGIHGARWFTTRGTRATVDRLIERGGVRQVFWRTIEGSPDIAVADSAAKHGLPVGPVLAAVTAGNVVRGGALAGAVAVMRKPLGKYIRQRYGMYLGVASVAVGGWVVVRTARWWGRRK